jgi:small GTP-binding protein
MGSFFTKAWNKLFKSDKDVRILIIGLDATGKTTIVQKIYSGETVRTIPTIGFNVQIVRRNNITFTMWDVGGGYMQRQLYKHYYKNTDGVIFVVDSNDKERLEEAKELLHIQLKQEELANVPFLVYANKQDFDNVLSPLDIWTGLELGLFKDKKIFVQGCTAINGTGLIEGLDWLANNMS